MDTVGSLVCHGSSSSNRPLLDKDSTFCCCCKKADNFSGNRTLNSFGAELWSAFVAESFRVSRIYLPLPFFTVTSLTGVTCTVGTSL